MVFESSCLVCCRGLKLTRVDRIAYFNTGAECDVYGCCVWLQAFYKQKGNRAVTRPQLMQETLDQCSVTVTEKLVSYTTQAQRYRDQCVVGQYVGLRAAYTVIRTR